MECGTAGHRRFGSLGSPLDPVGPDLRFTGRLRSSSAKSAGQSSIAAVSLETTGVDTLEIDAACTMLSR